MIDGVDVKELKIYADERGRVMEILRKDDPIFQKFGQTYLSSTFPNVVKAWHYHENQWDHICCIKGLIKLVLYDDRKNSRTIGEINEFYTGEFSPKVVLVPPGLWHGWKCVSLEEAMIINTVSEVFNKNKPDEVRVNPHKNDIPYSWERKDG